MANRNGKGSLARKANQKRRSTMNKIKKIEKQLKTAGGKAVEILKKRLEYHKNKS